VAFDFHADKNSPIVLTGSASSVFRADGGRRQFVTVKNVSDKASAALVFQQTLKDRARENIVALERVSVIFKPKETKRLSVSVEEVWQRAAKDGPAIGKPVLSIVVVEFVDGSTWSAPLERIEP
jgi:hypothetical protein